MPEAPTYVVAQAILEVLEAAFEAALRPHPRRYISDGGVVWDWTPLLSVEWDRNEPAYGADGAEGAINPAHMGGGFLPLRAVYNIHCTRDTPFADEAGTPPQPAKVELSARQVHADAALILDTLLGGLADTTLFGICGQVNFISQMAVGVDGGTVGSITTIGVSL
jgi:hypothetical protein